MNALPKILLALTGVAALSIAYPASVQAVPTTYQYNGDIGGSSRCELPWHGHAHGFHFVRWGADTNQHHPINNLVIQLRN